MFIKLYFHIALDPSSSRQKMIAGKFPDVKAILLIDKPDVSVSKHVFYINKTYDDTVACY